ncbi:MAG TPA: D-aminoacyl-tRNA deacylase [Hydrogenophaga sp.]|uniref:D-aminoacyl-tRNA deacylase n=1 Tax=Hydrogenophaga sp. TaxID=1904254 RepID=UPI002B9E881C|nr:D-aminoacyl-tRNA deacylase [Hydrogenophaga sp.]HMN93671.1 D-aminoacyl-tRNA deacylase [Hydrogenophaga sp.]HMP10958.1 D-aminoacyl-tRNA deacylase [Hydrogenophaga sp.]
MIVLLQRVSSARVEIGGETVGAIGPGLLALVCAEPQDTESVCQRMLDKILKLRIFGDEQGKMNRSVQDVGGGLLLVSQFTLAADTRHGNRPGFTAAAPPELGRALFDRFVALARARHPQVETGRFGAEMAVHLVNDGPVTIPLRMG